MIWNSSVPIPGWSFARAEQMAIELEALLKTHRLSIAPGSAFEAAVLTAMQIREWKRSAYTIGTGADVRSHYRAMFGVQELASLIVSVRNHANFNNLIPHLRLLSRGSALQNTKSRGNDEATNKLFELLVACLLMQFADEVELDDPTRSTGSNPDVLATIAGRRWGFACKVLHSIHPEGFLEHVRKGVAQIERSPAQVGVVVFNLKNVLPHDELWPRVPHLGGFGAALAAWPTADDANRVLRQKAEAVFRRIRSEVPNPASVMAPEFVGKKSVRAFLLYAPTVTGVLFNGQPATTILRMMIGMSVGPPLDRQDELVLECMNWAAYHDFPWRGPRPTPT
jgi:hypothetical protein